MKLEMRINEVGNAGGVLMEIVKAKTEVANSNNKEWEKEARMQALNDCHDAILTGIRKKQPAAKVICDMIDLIVRRSGDINFTSKNKGIYVKEVVGIHNELLMRAASEQTERSAKDKEIKVRDVSGFMGLSGALDEIMQTHSIERHVTKKGAAIWDACDISNEVVKKAWAENWTVKKTLDRLLFDVVVVSEAKKNVSKEYYDNFIDQMMAIHAALLLYVAVG